MEVPHFKSYHKATIIETQQYCCSARNMGQWKRIGGTERDPRDQRMLNQCSKVLEEIVECMENTEL